MGLTMHIRFLNAIIPIALEESDVESEEFEEHISSDILVRSRE